MKKLRYIILFRALPQSVQTTLTCQCNIWHPPCAETWFPSTEVHNFSAKELQVFCALRDNHGLLQLFDYQEKKKNRVNMYKATQKKKRSFMSMSTIALVATIPEYAHFVLKKASLLIAMVTIVTMRRSLADSLYLK